MAFNSNRSSATSKTEWKKILVPDSKMVGIFVNKESGKASLMFEVADSTSSKAVFFASASCVRRNSDRTGFIVSIPEGKVNLSESHMETDGTWSRKLLEADCVADLGYPFED